MNSRVKAATAPRSITMTVAKVRAILDNRLRLDDGTVAHLAPSCWLAPEVGDLVACLHSTESYVVHVLQRDANRRTARVALPGFDRLELCAAEIELLAQQKLSLTSQVDCEVVASAGTLSLNAENLVTTVVDTVMQIAGHVFTQAEDFVSRASHLISTHAQRQILVAEKEIRVDGEIIQMG